MTKIEILQYLQERKSELAQKYQASNIILFGSFARGDDSKESDIDIAIDSKITDYFYCMN